MIAQIFDSFPIYLDGFSLTFFPELTYYTVSPLANRCEEASDKDRSLD
jgi:hypothetical protein